MDSVVLLSSTGADRESWMSLWEAYGREPFAHPGYLESFCTRDDTANCAVITTSDGVAILPMILREIPVAVGEYSTVLRDASSPYGYGGPFGDDVGSLEKVWSVLAGWMSEHQIVSMFGRLSLDAPMPSPLLPGMVVRSNAENVVVDLRRSAEEQWRHYEHKVRKNVNKARRAGLRVRVAEEFGDLSEFSDLYAATMDRRNASDWYRFDETFFASLLGRVEGSYVVAEVRDVDDRLVSAELALCSDRFVYSFLGGTLPDAFPYAPNDLLKHELINYGRESGRVGFVLGGGYVANDGIFRYKRGFDRTGVVPFRRVEVLGDPTVYRRLVEDRLREGRATGAGAELAEGFFPTYRAPFAGRDVDASR
jgi:CelD/BcsL family acetyltransferase involved in cellulose biosynthesis